MNEIDEWRKEIDLIDNQLLELLQQRITVVKKVGEWKKKMNRPIVDKTREQEIIEKRSLQAQAYGISKDVVEKVWRTLFEIAYTVEEGK